MRVLLVFVDGVGLGDDAAYNPFTTASLPTFRRLLDGQLPLRAAAPRHATRASLLPLDATLGVAGTPQSGTGQTALLTGHNAALMHGNHFGPWVPARLRPLLRSEGILAAAAADGHRVTFANAYPEELIRMGDVDGARLPQFLRAGPPVAAMGAGVFTRNATDLIARDAVASEIVNDGWRDRLGINGLPEITARTGGEILARISGDFDVTLFAHYRTDDAGHSKELSEATAALERVDAFIDGIMAGLAGDCMLVIASDHGNIEDIRTGHTRNPALGLVVGAGHETVSKNVMSLLDVVPMIRQILAM